MGIGTRLRTLWHRRAGVVVCLLLSLLAAVWSVQKISLSPPGLTPRALEMATATTHVVVDTPTSTLLDLRQDTYSLEALTNRTVLLGNVLASAQVREAIAERAGIPAGVLRVEAPLTAEQPRAPVTAENAPKTSDILESTDQYRLSLQANASVPLLDFYSQTPDKASAERLANAAVDELGAYLAEFARTEQTPAKNQIHLVQLGRAEGTVINDGVRWQAALLAFFFTLALSCATMIFIARVREGWRVAARAEQPAAG